ncbi:MAG: signal peptidase I [Pseudomonadota bacterium]
MSATTASTWLPGTRAVVACILSVVLPGSGSFYLGRLRTALVALGFATLGSVAAGLLWRAGVIGAAPLVVAIALCTLVGHAGGALLAAIEAWQGRTKRAFVPSLGFMLLAASSLFAMRRLSQLWIMATYAVATIAMEPGLQHGDRVLVVPHAPEYAYPRGSIVALRDPSSGENFVRRLIAVGGDGVRIHDSEVLVNGHSLRQGPCDDSALMPCFVERSLDGLEYVVVERLADGGMDLQVTVPEGSVFVMRDRRDLSLPLDPMSREWLTGEVWDVWWSYTHQGVRLERLGLPARPRPASP